MKIREYALLVIGGGISILLAALAIFLLVRYSAQYRRVSEELRSHTSELEALQRRTPFPNEENVERAGVGLGELRQGFDQLVGVLAEGQREAVSIDRSQWPLLRQQLFGALTVRARASHVSLPDNFTYGFDRYARALPDARHLPRIIQQLGYVEWVCTLLLDSKVHAIRRIERHMFEDEVTEDDPWGEAPVRGRPAAVATGRRPPSRTDRREGAVFTPGYKEHPDSLYSRERMVFTFTVRESALWQILNALAQSETFCVVSRIQVRNPAPRPSAAPAGRGPGRSGVPPGRRMLPQGWEEDLDGEGPGAGAPSSLLRPDGTLRPPSRTERIAVGRDELLEVELEVDFYRFRPKGQPEEARL